MLERDECVCAVGSDIRVVISGPIVSLGKIKLTVSSGRSWEIIDHLHFVY